MWKKKHWVIYGRAGKNIYYSTLDDTMVYHRIFCKYVLDGLCFELNQYNAWCVVGKMRYGKVCTILWWVDDIKLSYKDANVIAGMLDKVRDKFGSIKDTSITETRGNWHNYLGMIINYSHQGEVKFTMYGYIYRK